MGKQMLLRLLFLIEVAVIVENASLQDHLQKRRSAGPSTKISSSESPAAVTSTTAGSFGNGRTGPTGNLSPIRPRGIAGHYPGYYPGPPGPPSPPGPPGPPTLPGPPGTPTPPGPTGAPTPPGRPCPVGTTCPPDPPSQPCPSCPPGLPGPTGPTCPPDPPSQPCPSCPPGPPGVPGRHGPPGPTGPRGIPGYPGVSGRPGSHGVPGPRGHAGYDGVNGRNGEQGYPGRPGAPGMPASSGVTYIRWGGRTCPVTAGTELIYAGRAAISHREICEGNNEVLCLPDLPEYGETREQNNSVRGDVAHENFTVVNNATGDVIPCAVCHVTRRSSIIIIPARLSCPARWTEEYDGNLVVGYGVGRIPIQCVDDDVEFLSAEAGNTNDNLLRVMVTCNGTPCPPYDPQKELHCVVCTK